MSVAVDVSADGVRLPIARARLADVARATLRAEKVSDALLSIAVLGDRGIAALNRRHLGQRGPTDVISFGFARSATGAPVVGDVYIGLDAARRNAAAAGVPLREELVRLVVHGVLHVLGHDHADGAERVDSDMWQRQERLVRRLTTAARR